MSLIAPNTKLAMAAYYFQTETTPKAFCEIVGKHSAMVSITRRFQCLNFQNIMNAYFYLDFSLLYL